MTASPEIRDIPLPDIARGGPLRAAFETLHHQWTDRGLTRWLDLFEPDHHRPVLALGAFLDGQLIGAVIGVWHPTPCDRFDALLESDPNMPKSARPAHGAWHLIAVTTAEDNRTRGTGLGRVLLGHILELLRDTGHAEVLTLSPVVGLPRLLALWDGPLEDAVLHASLEDGRPFLPIMRLHLGAGARLDAILRDSRHDDLESAQANLRFRYSTTAQTRATQRQSWDRWVGLRSNALSQIDTDIDPKLWRAAPQEDSLVSDAKINIIF